MRSRSLAEEHHYKLLREYLISQKEILELHALHKTKPLPASISDARPMEFKNHYDALSSEVKRIAAAIENEQDKDLGPASPEVLATREAQAVVVEKAIRRTQVDDALRAAGLEVPQDFTIAVKPIEQRPILKVTTQKNADGTSTFDISSSASSSASSTRLEAPTLTSGQETREGLFSSIVAKVSDFTPSIPTSVLSLA
jgi:hypothetical protein